MLPQRRKNSLSLTGVNSTTPLAKDIVHTTAKEKIYFISSTKTLIMRNLPYIWVTSWDWERADKADQYNLPSKFKYWRI